MELRASKWFRIVGFSLTGGLFVYLVGKVLISVGDPNIAATIATTDHQLYMQQAHRILAGGPVYQAFQLAGPYQMTDRPELYPPTTIFGLLLPLSLLPDPVWWIVPLGILAAVTLWHRPGVWAWFAIGLCLAWPNTGLVIVAGNPVIWAAAGLALGTVWRWPSVLVLLKPSLFPFALFGVRSRGWWIALAIFGAASLAMLPLWLDYLTVLRNGRLDLLYSVGHIPLMLIPLLAWAGRTRRRGSVRRLGDLHEEHGTGAARVG